MFIFKSREEDHIYYRTTGTNYVDQVSIEVISKSIFSCDKISDHVSNMVEKNVVIGYSK